MKTGTLRSIGLVLGVFCMVACIAIVRLDAQPGPGGAVARAQTEASRVAVDADNIGGVVTSSKGPEAGVWVIAETNDFQTKFRKIVVTDDQGRYLIPQMPKANYKIWVRGYGLVDSKPVDAAPGKALALTAVVAPTPQAAAKYYPPNYWYSMLKVPPKDAFPMTIPGEGNFSYLRTGRTIESQAAWIWTLRRGCPGLPSNGQRGHSRHRAGTRDVSNERSGLGAKAGGRPGNPAPSQRGVAGANQPRRHGAVDRLDRPH